MFLVAPKSVIFDVLRSVCIASSIAVATSLPIFSVITDPYMASALGLFFLAVTTTSSSSIGSVSAATPAPSVISTSNSALVPASPLLNTLPILFPS